jgi:AraC-like DNA-binding protein
LNKGHFSRFSTVGLPERRRLSVWRETFSQVVLKTDVTAPKDEPFRAELNMCALPGLGISWGTTSSQRAERTPGLLVDGDDDVILLVSSAGTVRAEQIGRETLITSGRAVLVSGADRGVVSCGSQYSHVTLKIPRRELSPLVGDLDQAIMRPIAADVEALRMLGIYTRGIRSGFFPAAAELQHLAGTHMRDLVALALGAVSDASEMLRKRGLRAARLKAILAHIAANLDRPRLSLNSASGTLGISPRYVQVLLKETGTTFSDLVLTQRLARARQMLTHPNLAYRSISSIAFEVGFGDVSYFNRAFRRAYGGTPSDIRAQVKANGLDDTDIVLRD